MLQDIAVLTSAKVISEEVGLELENTTLEDLGSAKRVVVTKDNTTIIDGAAKQKILKHALIKFVKKLKIPLLIMIVKNCKNVLLN